MNGLAGTSATLAGSADRAGSHGLDARIRVNGGEHRLGRRVDDRTTFAVGRAFPL
ncbi:hypothetical protein [Actinoplanes xinjiangensis]|uniref:hypothetical protein n=1 Tax=Actinoplanes xinjiangensis TaxID=512350 RepID=UPI0034434C9D